METTVTLQVDPEFVALGNAIAGLIADIKAGKTVVADAEDAFGALVVAVGNVSNIGTDALRIDNQVGLLKAVLAAIEPAQVAA